MFLGLSLGFPQWLRGQSQITDIHLSGVSPRIATKLGWRGHGYGREAVMAMPLRFQYPGAVYHVMARGDGGKVVFETDDDRLVFLKRLEETCGSCGW